MHVTAIRSSVSLPTLLLLLLVNGCTTQSKTPSDFPQPRTNVINDDDSNQIFLPTGQILTPAGWQIPLPRIRPQGLALSPNGRLLAVAGATEEVFLVDPRTGKMLQ